MPHFLGVQAVLAIHDDQIRLYGGAYGVRDWNALESSVRQPAATFGGTYLYGDVFAMASALGHGLMTSHPFLDGNKRTGGMAMLTFLAAVLAPLLARWLPRLPRMVNAIWALMVVVALLMVLGWGRHLLPGRRRTV